MGCATDLQRAWVRATGHRELADDDPRLRTRHRALCPVLCPVSVPRADESACGCGSLGYRYGDSNPGFRRERAAS